MEYGRLLRLIVLALVLPRRRLHVHRKRHAVLVAAHAAAEATAGGGRAATGCRACDVSTLRPHVGKQRPQPHHVVRRWLAVVRLQRQHAAEARQQRQEHALARRQRPHCQLLPVLVLARQQADVERGVHAGHAQPQRHLAVGAVARAHRAVQADHLHT
eukprot:84865-Chlamydomonas_euryale.AAC.1